MIARVWFGVTGLVVAVGLGVQVWVTARATGGHFETVGGRILNLLFFFTILSNVIVGVTSVLLAVRPRWDSMIFRVLRLDGVVAIAVTFVVFRVALADLYDLHGAAAFADFMLHVAAPVLCVAGWAMFGPRHRGGMRIVGWAAIFPIGYLVITLIRGPIVDWYPYPFLDVRTHGYAGVLLSSVLVGVSFLALAAAIAAVDGRLAQRRTGDSTDARAVI